MPVARDEGQRDPRDMLELFMIRHGQTDYSRENRFCGSIDPSLNDTGLRMADAFGAAYAGQTWSEIYCSPSLRARQTAEALSKRIAMSLTLDEGLREIAYGEWEGLRHEDAKARFPDAYAYWAADTASRGTPGGETAFQVAARAAPVIERIRAKHSEGRILIVSHKATIRILTCALLGMDVRLFRDRIGQPVAAVTRFEIKKTGPILTLLGDVSHLPADLKGLEGT
jgi:probable phosphoglycerate mutase